MPLSHLKQIVAASLFAIVLIVGVVAYNVFKAPAEATGPIEAIPLATSAPVVSDVPTTGAAAATVGQTPSGSAATAAPAASADALVVQIVPGESEARFVIDEVLNNAPKTVVGATDQVAGEIAIDPDDPTNTRVGVIQVNARALTTDNDFRNRALKNQILQTDQYEFVTFTPTEIVGLPQAGAVGEPYTFQLVGDLTIRDVTQRVTFDVTAQATSESRLEGTATTTIAYADYGITIPQVRQVAGIADQVRLELDFVAAAA